MAAKGRHPPQHRLTGAKLGCHGEVAELVIRCGSCGKIQTATIEADLPARAALAGVSCASCGRLGLMRVWMPSKAEGDAAADILDRAAARKGAA